MLTVNELFAGIGAFRKALIRLGIPHEVVGISEIDKYAIKSYNAIYGETRNYGDISKVERLDYADLWTYGFPCQDISLAGQLKGIVKGETRSGLLYEVQRLLAQAQSMASHRTEKESSALVFERILTQAIHSLLLSNQIQFSWIN